MSYRIELTDPVTHTVLHTDTPHHMCGVNYALHGTTELSLNVTYNYSRYYSDLTREELLRTENENEKIPFKTSLRDIYGLTAVDSIPMLENMIHFINDNYRDKHGNWYMSTRVRIHYFDENGEKHDIAKILMSGKPYTTEKEVYTVSEGDTSDYWIPTAANALRPLHQLLVMAKLRPDGVWAGD